MRFRRIEKFHIRIYYEQKRKVSGDRFAVINGTFVVLTEGARKLHVYLVVLQMEVDMGDDTACAGQDAIGGKYLTFQLGSEVFGIQILRVQEIIGMMHVTGIPATPPEVRGVVNLRGKVIPVVDLRVKFGMVPQADTDRTCITVVQMKRRAGQMTIGIVVDNVCEVLDIDGKQIEPPPAFGGFEEACFILGMAKVGEGVITLLDIESALAGSNFEGAGTAFAEAAETTV